jgi:ATP-binding cassette subfamily G (WHITE) protein 2 (PDR)
VDTASEINYQGIPMKTMHKDFRGEAIYQAEVDVHFPQLTVGQTLSFAAAARAPNNRFPGVSRQQYADHMRDVIMTIFGLSHTVNTKVGNDFIRGVSGGERKRVSIAEACLGGSPLQCWDNSTRGLDSATALEFVKTLRISTELGGSAAVVAIYQASQSIYDVSTYDNPSAVSHLTSIGLRQGCSSLRGTPDLLRQHSQGEGLFY